MSVDSGCLLMGDRLVIPSSLREKVLTELHDGHPGITRMKLLARGKVWWRQLDAHIEAKVRQCIGCNKTAKSPPDTSRSHEWPKPAASFDRIHLDFAGPFQDKYFLILVDALSNWPEVCSMTRPNTDNTIQFLRSVFCREGLPLTLVTDNGTQFTSDEFERFCRENGIRHILTAPYHPSSNGEAERMVQNVKNSLKAMAAEPGDLTCRIQRFLFNYRTTPNAVTGKSSADIHRGRPLRSRLDQLRPPVPIKEKDSTNPGRTFCKGERV